MRQRDINLLPVLGTVLILSASQPALGAYASIWHDLLDGIPDTTYEGGVLTVHSPLDANNAVSLADGSSGVLPGSISNTSVTLTTSLTTYDPVSDVARFTGGIYSLTFDYGGVTGYELSGPIHHMDLKMEVLSPSFSMVFAEGLLTATAVNLPGSNDWPDGAGFSEIAGMAIYLDDMDLTGFDWLTDTFADGESTYVLFPGPEPATLPSLGLAYLLLARRRRFRLRSARISSWIVNPIAACALLSSLAFGLEFRESALDENCTEKPGNDLVARINRLSPESKITAIVIAPNYILTVGHWGYLYTPSPETEVDIEIGGQVETYKIVDARQEDSPSFDYGVYRIETLDDEDADLSHWLDFYIVQDELGKEFVVGSYGPQPQAGLPAGTLHWGKNVVTTGTPGAGEIGATFNSHSGKEGLR